MDVLKGQSRERGGNMSSFDDMCFHKFQIGASELCFFKGRAGYLVLVLHLMPFLVLGDHINVRKPQSEIFMPWDL